MTAGGEGRAVPGSNPAPSGAGHIHCAICTGPISLDQYRTARCWADPDGITVAAHADCLVRVGEQDLRLA
jgi:hypothetical protein